jgi:SAM-dependent methyltransferase
MLRPLEGGAVSKGLKCFKSLGVIRHTYTKVHNPAARCNAWQYNARAVRLGASGKVRGYIFKSALLTRLSMESSFREFGSVLADHGIDPTMWLSRASHTFAPIDFRGKTVLDVGSGAGWGSFYAAAAGAKRVVGLEPEAQGSRGAMLDTAALIRDALDLRETVEFVPTPLQDAHLSEPFDVVMMINSINHLDEASCIVLDKNDEARAEYTKLLSPVTDLCRPGGKLLITDCTNRNLFGDIGIRSPLAPTIEWEKHQPAHVWADLFSSMGFERPEIAWTPHPRLGRLGKLLAMHRWLAYLSLSHFRLTLTRSAAPVK